MSNIQHVQDSLDRSKTLDNALFIGLCGLGMCREKMFITGVVRLEMAVHGLQQSIKHIYGKHVTYIDKGCNSEEHN